MCALSSTIPLPERSPARQPLTRSEVVDAAITIIDSQGIDALSMRGLAQELGVYPSAIYWHAGNKAQLLSLVYQRLMQQLELPDLQSMEWDEWVLAMARAVRDEFGKHPDLAGRYGSQLQVTSSGLEFAEQVLRVLSQGGFSDGQLPLAYNTIMSAVFGWMSGEYAIEPADAEEEWQNYLEKHVSEGITKLPTINRYRSELLNRSFSLRWESGQKAPLTESFEFNMRVVIEGLKHLKD